MAGYFVANYTITNLAGYKEYLAAVGPTLEAHGAERIIVDRDSELLEGSAGQVTVVLRFATLLAMVSIWDCSARMPVAPMYSESNMSPPLCQIFPSVLMASSVILS